MSIWLMLAFGFILGAALAFKGSLICAMTILSLLSLYGLIKGDGSSGRFPAGGELIFISLLRDKRTFLHFFGSLFGGAFFSLFGILPPFLYLIINAFAG